MALTDRAILVALKDLSDQGFEALAARMRELAAPDRRVARQEPAGHRRPEGATADRRR